MTKHSKEKARPERPNYPQIKNALLLPQCVIRRGEKELVKTIFIRYIDSTSGYLYFNKHLWTVTRHYDDNGEYWKLGEIAA